MASLATTITINGTMSGIDTASAVTLVLTQSTTFALPSSVTLASGFNSIPVPTGVQGGVVIDPPNTNAQTITLKGVTGDTGTPLSKVNATLVAFDTAPPATIGLTAGAGINNVRLYWF